MTVFLLPKHNCEHITIWTPLSNPFNLKNKSLTWNYHKELKKEYVVLWHMRSSIESLLFLVESIASQLSNFLHPKTIQPKPMKQLSTQLHEGFSQNQTFNRTVQQTMLVQRKKGKPEHQCSHMGFHGLMHNYRSTSWHLYLAEMELAGLSITVNCKEKTFHTG